MSSRGSSKLPFGVCQSLVGVALLLVSGALTAQDLSIYDDSLASGFQDWSWATHNLSNPDPVASGSLSISFEADAWEGLFFHSDTPLDLADWQAVQLAIHGGPAGGQLIRLSLDLGGVPVGEIALAGAPANQWDVRTLDFRAAGMVTGLFDGVILQDATGGDQSTLFLDDLVLVEDTSPPPPPVSVAVSIDPGADRRPIDPAIYGVNFGDATRFAEVGYPLRRWGGNAVTRYNWRVAVHNTASDYFFQNIVDSVPDPSTLPHGSSSDLFVDETLAAGAEVLLTAPAIGWTPLDQRSKLWGFSVDDYGQQLLDECSFYAPNPPAWCTADAGDGTCNPAINTTGFCSPEGEIIGNDPNDTSQAIGPSFVTDWVNHLVSRVGRADQGGVRYWAVDNEPMLWNSTHRDVFPTPLTYDELWSRTLSTANAIKAADPSTQVLGPAVWGWCAFFTSASDAAFPNGSCVDGPDRQGHGGVALLPWYLDQVCNAAGGGTRPIDLLDVHFYPQGDVSGLGGASNAEDPTTSARRLRSVAELWDPTYTSESWINEPVYLIPRLRTWIDDHCPGVGLAITEYKWGTDDGASSALSHAEVLAVFGREGVDLATRWVAPEEGTRVENAFEIFLDYDGLGSRVSGDSIRAVSDSPDEVGAYAIAGADDELWVLLINRALSVQEAEVAVASELLPEVASIYQFDASTPLGPAGVVSTTVEGFTVDLPPRSVTLVEATLATAAGLIFRDGFESGDILAWSP